MTMEIVCCPILRGIVSLITNCCVQILTVIVLCTDEDLMAGGNLFEDTPAVPEVAVATPAPQHKQPGQCLFQLFVVEMKVLYH